MKRFTTNETVHLRFFLARRNICIVVWSNFFFHEKNKQRNLVVHSQTPKNDHVTKLRYLGIVTFNSSLNRNFSEKFEMEAETNHVHIVSSLTEMNVFFNSPFLLFVFMFWKLKVKTHVLSNACSMSLSLFRSSLLNNIKYICVLVMALSNFVTCLHSIAKREIKAFPIVQIAGPLQSRPQIHPIEHAGWHYMR